MKNAKKEFLGKVGNKEVKCATIRINKTDIDLKINYSEDEYKSFLEKLDFEYDASYGRQELYGYIWSINGTWFERGEDDGAEWWEYKTTPEIPKKLFKNL